LMLAFLERTWINDWLGWLALERWNLGRGVARSGICGHSQRFELYGRIGHYQQRFEPNWGQLPKWYYLRHLTCSWSKDV
jgi:hypothetical protein